MTVPSGENRDLGLVPTGAWAADEEARRRGRVAMFNVGRGGGLDGWTMDLDQYQLLRAHVLEVLDDTLDKDGAVLLKDLVATAEARFSGHPSFPDGLRPNYVISVKVDLHARGVLERLPGTGPQRVRRRHC